MQYLYGQAHKEIAKKMGIQRAFKLYRKESMIPKTKCMQLVLQTIQ